MFKKYKQSSTSVNYAYYSLARHKYNSLNSKCYLDYLQKMKRHIKCNPKSFFQFVNSKRKVSSFPRCMKYGSIECSDNAGISNLFAKFFQLSPYQHGFVKGRSTTTNLMELSCHVYKGFSIKCQTDIIYTDFSKAFDTVVHELLCYKLDRMGFPRVFLNWISSYLSGRTQKVMFNKHFSDDILVTSGVPQGSHLGPLLFILYLNDLPSVISFSKVLMYADDIKLFLPLKTRSESSLLQHNLYSIANWCSVNGMSLNLKKCKKLSLFRIDPLICEYYIGPHKLESVDSFVDLGVILDHKLRFNLHIDACINKAKSLLGFIKRWSKEFNVLNKTAFC